ncbi:MAG: methionine--tRNA ligase [Candidatus Aenigmarchaeota archaeon]|nr:methionine--tRNA ligase [Candidatus Aenigmarchaeota archaeon]
MKAKRKASSGNKPGKKFYITTAIPYVNASPHIGHALEFVQTDAIARFHKLAGSSVYLTTGADENSLKNVQAAEQKGLTTQQLCDQNSALFKAFAAKIGTSNDVFLRSSSRTAHWPGVQKLWQLCVKRGDVYKKKYKGLYCVGCEALYTPEELVDGCCHEHKSNPDPVEEENYFFRLSKYQKRIAGLIESGELLVLPEAHRREALAFVKAGLEDFSISRSVARAKGWGVPVPGDASQIMYVWFDALGVYLTGVGYGTDEAKFKKWWPADMHVIGKGITRFHVVYWPAMLLSAGLPTPRSVFVHGYVTADGQKMSKSLGNVVDPVALIDKYGADVVRYYLLNEIPTFEDGDFSEARLIEKTNNELIANFGNYIYRVLSFLKSNFKGKIPKPGRLGKDDAALLKKLDGTKAAVEKAMADYRLQDAMHAVLELSVEGNRYFQANEPWKTAKSDKAKCSTTLYVAANVVRGLAALSWPFLPFSAEVLWKQLAIKEKMDGLKEVGKKRLEPGHKIGGIAPLFKKIELMEETDMQTKKKTETKTVKKTEKKMMKIEPKLIVKAAPVVASAAAVAPAKPTVTFADFQKLNLRVGRVESAEPVPGSTNLLRLMVDFGDERLQAVSGIARWYAPDDVVGKEFMFITNLERRKFMGVESQCMIFAAEEDGIPVLLTPEKQVKPGSFVH